MNLDEMLGRERERIHKAWKLLTQVTNFTCCIVDGLEQNKQGIQPAFSINGFSNSNYEAN